jgi:hypothetical protein
MIPLLCAIAFADQWEVFVSKSGSDASDGTKDHPVATLERAVARHRELKANIITIQGGEYSLDHSIELDGRDAQVDIRGEKGTRPMITGSVLIPKGAMKRCKDSAILNRIIDPAARSIVMEIDLKPFLKSALAPVAPYGFTTPVSVGPNELFADGTPMTVARWPNKGFTTIGSVFEPGNGEMDREKPARKPVFSGVSDRAKLWTKAKNLWLFGYWKFDWADESMRVDSIDAQNGQITLIKPHSYGVEKGAQFFAENLIEELDQPGEYVLDRESSKAYLIPLSDTKQLRLSTLSGPLISVDSVRSVHIQRVDLAYSRGDGLKISNSQLVRVEGCQLFNLGERAATIEGSLNHIAGCNIWNTGEGGISLGGGDRKGLIGASNTVLDCDIHHFQRRTQTYRPAVNISGVGNSVIHCAIHDAPHSAIIFSGNNHRIEYNEFYRTLSRTGDGGVVYTGRDWTARGTEINYNYFHDNIGMSKWEPAIYFDDLASGLIAKGHLIERCHWGFLIGGGRDNILSDNVIVDCKLGFDCDARGLGWAASSKPTMMERLNAMPVQEYEWTRRYPSLATILKNQPMAPMGNVLQNNFLIRSGKMLDRTEDSFKKSAQYLNNVETIVPDLWSKVPGIPKLPISQMGLRSTTIRRSLPNEL